MESSMRKRKLNELDKNVVTLKGTPRTQNQQVGGESGLQLAKLIAPSNALGYLQKFVQDKNAETNLENKKPTDKEFRKSFKPETARGHFKTCDRKYLRLKKDLEQKRKEQAVEEMESTTMVAADESSGYISQIEISKNEPNDRLVGSDRCDLRMWFGSEYLEDILDHELQKEKEYKFSEHFCQRYDADPAKRKILIDWLISVQMELKAENHTLHLAVTLMDILLDRVYVPCERLQVSAIAAFWVAYKFVHGNLRVKTLTDLCAGKATNQMILEQELLVLESSRFLKTGGDISVFYNYLLLHLFGNPYPPEVYYCGQYLIEIMLLEFSFVDCTGCEKAITALYVSLKLFDSTLRYKLYEFTRFITRMKLQLMYHHLVKILLQMYTEEKILKSSSVFKKYSSSRYLRISDHQVFKALKYNNS